MFLKRSLLPLLIMAVLFGGGVLLAQDATPAATDVPAATDEPAAATAEATIEPGELSQSVVLGGLVVNVPQEWTVIQGQQGDVVASNVDLYKLDPNTPFPPDTVLIQINLYNTSQLPVEAAGAKSAKEILEAIPTDQEKPPVTEVQVGDVVLGRMRAKNPQGDTFLYAIMINDDTFIFAIAASISAGTLDKYDATVQQVLAHIQLDASAPIADGALTRFDGIPQSTSPEGFPRLGNPDAPVKIQEISSFACPACRSFQDFAMPVLLDRIKAGDVRFEYVPYIGTGHIANNEQATNAALCAAEQGKFWEYHDALFAWQDFGTTAFLTERLYAGAAAVALDKDKFGACLTDEHTDKIIEAAVTYSNSLAGFVGTPTVLLNGTIVNWNPDELNAAIDAAIQAQAEATAEATGEATAAATSEAGAKPTAEATAES